ncbi:MAG: YifB family Mg chelatase-like AAA ATPase [Solirubrobacterales bacterium]
MLAKTFTYAIDGVAAKRVTVEVDIRRGLPAFAVVGLPDAAVRESRERVRAALLNEGFEFPQRRITVNLAPADLQKAGPAFDLAIAAAVLSASAQIEPNVFNDVALVGELSLDGGVHGIRGTLAITEAATANGLRLLAIPSANAREAALVEGVDLAVVRRLGDLVAIATGDWETPISEQAAPPPSVLVDGPDLKDLRGHAFSQRALEIAAAGGHNALLMGPPGCGKTMLARRLPSILPPMTHAEALEVTRVQSVTGNLRVDGLVKLRPFRAPHHTISSAGLVGGGAVPTPGEVTLATHGVLFLDELAEFSTRTLEALRQPLEAGTISVTRSQRTMVFPARTMLIAATNPCPCGAGDHRCRCSEAEVARYHRRLSGPLLDRFDLYCRVDRPTAAEVEAGPLTDSASARQRVGDARSLQAERFAHEDAHCNGHLDGAQTRRLLRTDDRVRALLNESYRRGSLTLRGYDRALRVARTIADLDGDSSIGEEHIAEALAFRVSESGCAQ